MPAEDQHEADMVAQLAAQLAAIHDVAETIFRDLNPGNPDTAFELLNTLAYIAMNGGMEEPEPHALPWHALADQFTSHCRLGFLAGVMLEESPFGNLNIRATTIDAGTRKSIDLQVYWKQDNEGEDAEHWLSVGTATGPAHDVDPEYPELLAASLRTGATIFGTPSPTSTRWCTWQGPSLRPGRRRPSTSWTPGKKWSPSRTRCSTR